MNFETMQDSIIHGDCIRTIKFIPENSIHLILSDIPYGIGADDWDVLHNNTNSAFLGNSPAQAKGGSVFKNRGKPLNGWSEADKHIPQEYYNWCLQWAGDWLRILKPGASAIVFAGRRLSHRCITALEDTGFTYKDMLAWYKQKAPHRAQRISKVYDNRNDEVNSKKWEGWRVGNLRPIFEPILWFTKPYKIGGTLADNLIKHEVGAYNEIEFLRYTSAPNNCIHIGAGKNDIGLHPTQKPVGLMNVLIKLTTKENHIVLDPFCGSASTCVSAFALNRRYIGIEQSKKYFDIAQKRMQEQRQEFSLFGACLK